MRNFCKPDVKIISCELCMCKLKKDEELYICISCDSSICHKCTYFSTSNVPSVDMKINQRLCNRCFKTTNNTADTLAVDTLVARVREMPELEKLTSEGLESNSDVITSSFVLRQPRGEVSARDIIDLITVKNHWNCRSCGICGTYKSPHKHFCGGAYFGWIIGATPTEGRTCCNCVKRVTGSDAGYILWSCFQCKARKAAMSFLDYKAAGFEVGMCKYPLNSPEGMDWLLTEADEQSGPVWLRHVPRLDISDLQFTDITSLFTAPLISYINIVQINISNNILIEGIPVKELCNMKHLVEFECINCPRLITPPPEIAIQGGMSVMQFLRALVSDGAHNTSMVLFLIGDGESGKTSLLSALKAHDNKSKKIHRDNRTVGIDITSWSLNASDAVDFTVYDMAGQSIYKDTHAYFVGRRAIYLFVWRLVSTADVKDMYIRMKVMVESWVDTLQLRIPGASIMVIATHIDHVTAEEIQHQTQQVQEIILQRVKLYDGGVPLRVFRSGDSLLVNSIDGTGVLDCRDQIVAFSKSLPWYNELLPKSWIELEVKLGKISQDEGRYFLSWDEFCDTALSQGIEVHMTMCVARFFHETGKLRYFGIGASTDHPGSPISTHELATSLDTHDQYLKPSSPSIKKPINFLSSIYKFVSGKENKSDVIKQESSFFLTDKDVCESLNSTVYISPAWLCNVLKGVIRHERDSLLRYFIKTNNHLLVRRVKRLLKCGRMHWSLVEFTFPSTSGSNDYWSKNCSIYEQELWNMDVVKSEDDVIRAFSVLSGFDIIALRGNEIIIPSLIGPSNFLKASDAHVSSNQRYFCTFEYLALPSGFFERVLIRLSRVMSHIDMTSNAAYLYSLGNVGGMFLSVQDVARLTISTSAIALFLSIKKEIHDVELFFPGIHKSVVFESKEPAGMDTPQVLIVSSSVSKVGNRVQALIHEAHPSLVIQQQAKKFFTPDVLNCHMAIICVDKNLQKSAQAIACIKALSTAGTFLIPLIMDGYEIMSYTHWWPISIPELESHKLFIDLRSNFEYQVKTQVLPVILKNLNAWRCQMTKDVVTSSDHILCDQCVIDCCPVYSSFKRDMCKTIVDDWNKQQSEAGLVGLEEVPSILCANGHAFDPQMLLSKNTSRDAIPCQGCLQSHASKPHLFDREELILRFDDDVKKVGFVTCPECDRAHRPATFQIVDVLKTDVFISYSWGKNSLTQGYIIPFVRKIELETNILCWFDIHGGLSAGQDHLKEMIEGVDKCSIFILCLTDSYVISENCQREFIQSVKQGKYIIPLLLPQISTDGFESAGWSGSCSPWWMHAEKLSTGFFDPDNKDRKIPWLILQNFDPIDLRDLSVKDHLSVAGEEIICRILARLHRGRSTKAFDLLYSVQ